MQQNLKLDDINENLDVLDPDTIDEVEVETDPWGSDPTVEELGITEMGQAEARKTLILAMNRIVQSKNAAALAKHRKKVKEWEKKVLDEENEGRHLPFPEPPMLLKSFNTRQLNQAVFRARQYGNFSILLEKAGFRAKK